MCPIRVPEEVTLLAGNFPSQSAGTTHRSLGPYGIQGVRFMMWPLASLGLDPIKYFWSIITQDVYADRRHFTLICVLWVTIKAALDAS